MNSGPGRMLEPLEIVVALGMRSFPVALGSAQVGRRKAVVTAGPTREAVDPVRFISNKSSGQAGYAIAAALATASTKTTLVSGPVDLAALAASIVSASKLPKKCFRPCGEPASRHLRSNGIDPRRLAQKTIGSQKTKGPKGPRRSNSQKNPDISQRSRQRRPSLVVDLPRETENLIENAKAKLKRTKHAI